MISACPSEDFAFTARGIATTNAWESHSEMNDASISLRAINDLLKERFFVPSYQRGFRWTKLQIVDLLNDIWEFQSTCEKREHFYCLQPIVVKRLPSGEWELVDGQQRLTTILLILACQSDLVKALRKPVFALSFETRPKSGEFLKNIDPKQRDANIDYHHICQAYETIGAWFAEEEDGLLLLQSLTNGDEAGKNVKVIWYELPESEDPVDVFTRLNVGKIPLTNSELIRALFLRSRNFGGGSKHVHQIKIAQEWDGIEKSLQADEMWYFLTTGATSPASRIEFLFNLIAGEHTTATTGDPFATFHFYNGRLGAAGVTAEDEWLKVKQIFMTLEEWFSDRILFHLVGYLIHANTKLGELRRMANGATKSEFRRALRRTIFQRLTGQGIHASETLENYKSAVSAFVDNLDYESNRSAIFSVLLLFNIATLLLNSKSHLRFPFHHFKKLDWHIEHVRSVKSDKPDQEPKCRVWLQGFVAHLGDVTESKALCARAQALLESDPFDMAVFDQLYADVLAAYQESAETDTDNGVGNLTLLDAGTNQSYKNAVFPVKRARIIGLDREGTFVPLCTKNVFLKYYSREIGKMMFWGANDRDAYRDSIVDTLSQFFAKDIME